MTCATALLTHCSRGHEWTQENTRLYFVDGRLRQRHCKTCHRIHSAKRAAEIREAKRPTAVDPKILARIRDARADGVSASDCCERFGMSRAQIAEALGER